VQYNAQAKRCYKCNSTLHTYQACTQHLVNSAQPTDRVAPTDHTEGPKFQSVEFPSVEDVYGPVKGLQAEQSVPDNVTQDDSREQIQVSRTEKQVGETIIQPEEQGVVAAQETHRSQEEHEVHLDTDQQLHQESSPHPPPPSNPTPSESGVCSVSDGPSVNSEKGDTTVLKIQQSAVFLPPPEKVVPPTTQVPKDLLEPGKLDIAVTSESDDGSIQEKKRKRGEKTSLFKWNRRLQGEHTVFSNNPLWGV